MSANGAGELGVDPQAVIDSLAGQIARLTVELALRDAAVTSLRADLEALRSELPESKSEPVDA